MEPLTKTRIRDGILGVVYAGGVFAGFHIASQTPAALRHGALLEEQCRNAQSTHSFSANICPVSVVGKQGFAAADQK